MTDEELAAIEAGSVDPHWVVRRLVAEIREERKRRIGTEQALDEWVARGEKFRRRAFALVRQCSDLRQRLHGERRRRAADIEAGRILQELHLDQRERAEKAEQRVRELEARLARRVPRYPDRLELHGVVVTLHNTHTGQCWQSIESLQPNVALEPLIGKHIRILVEPHDPKK